MQADYLKILGEYLQTKHPKGMSMVIIHSALVTNKALEIAKEYNEKHPEEPVDLRLLEEIGMLHDIACLDTNTPILHAEGEDHYITHLTKGEEILNKKGHPVHGRAARIHGNITKEEIIEAGLELEPQDHLPTTKEEEILTLADYYYRKLPETLFKERTHEEIRALYHKYGEGAKKRFNDLYNKYEA